MEDLLADILKGKRIAKAAYERIREEVMYLSERGVFLKTAVVKATDDPAVASYISMIEKKCKVSDILFETADFGNQCGTDDIVQRIKELNNDDSVHGVIIMLPLWKHIDTSAVTSALSPVKDIDGVTVENAGKLMLGQEAFIPNTAQACIDIMEGYGIACSGKNVVIVGRSNIVGKPLSLLLMRKGVDATVTVCHSRTENLADVCRRADILIAAAGVPRFITEEYTSPGQIVIDVGINEVKGLDGEKTLTGDTDFEALSKKVAAITPVPGGVSPLTNAALLKNLVKAAKIQLKMNKSVHQAV